MKASDIPDKVVLDIVSEYNEGRYPDEVIKDVSGRVPPLPDYIYPAHETLANWMDIADRLPEYPPKVVIAKCRSLIKRGLMHGCTCGCRGDFYLCGDQVFDNARVNLVTGKTEHGR